MKQSDIKIGGIYRAKINRRLTRVTVLHRAETDRRMGERGSVIFECIREDGRTFNRTARELRRATCLCSPRPVFRDATDVCVTCQGLASATATAE